MLPPLTLGLLLLGSVLLIAGQPPGAFTIFGPFGYIGAFFVLAPVAFAALYVARMLLIRRSRRRQHQE